MSNGRETHPPGLLLAAAESLVTRNQTSFTAADLNAALAWLTEPARSEIVEALRRSGWIARVPTAGRGAGVTYRLTEVGLQAYEAFQRAAESREGMLLPGFPGELGLERMVRALLSRGLEELAAAGREALIPVLPPPLLLSTDAVAQSAERYTASLGKREGRMG